MEFILKERLQWTELEQKDPAPFRDPGTGARLSINPAGYQADTVVGDIKILYNDWPYGIDERIVHLVVWTKFDLPDDPDTKELTQEMRREIDEYVDKTFCQAVAKENVSGTNAGLASRRSLI